MGSPRRLLCALVLASPLACVEPPLPSGPSFDTSIHRASNPDIVERLGWLRLGGGRSERPVDDEIRALMLVPSGALWIVGKTGLSRLANGEFQHMTGHNWLPSTQILDATLAGEGIAVGTFDGLLWVEAGPFDEPAAGQTGKDEPVMQLAKGTFTDLVWQDDQLWAIRSVPGAASDIVSISFEDGHPDGNDPEVVRRNTSDRRLLAGGRNGLLLQNNETRWTRLTPEEGRLDTGWDASTQVHAVLATKESPYEPPSLLLLGDRGIARDDMAELVVLDLGEGPGAMARSRSRDHVWVARKGLVAEIDITEMTVTRRLEGPGQLTPSAMAEDWTGRLWVGTGDGLYFADPGRSWVVEIEGLDTEGDAQDEAAGERPAGAEPPALPVQDGSEDPPVEDTLADVASLPVGVPEVVGFRRDGGLWAQDGGRLHEIEPDGEHRSTALSFDDTGPGGAPIRDAIVDERVWTIDGNGGVSLGDDATWDPPPFTLDEDDLKRLERLDELWTVLDKSRKGTEIARLLDRDPEMADYTDQLLDALVRHYDSGELTKLATEGYRALTKDEQAKLLIATPDAPRATILGTREQSAVVLYDSGVELLHQVGDRRLRWPIPLQPSLEGASRGAFDSSSKELALATNDGRTLITRVEHGPWRFSRAPYPTRSGKLPLDPFLPDSEVERRAQEESETELAKTVRVHEVPSPGRGLVLDAGHHVGVLSREPSLSWQPFFDSANKVNGEDGMRRLLGLTRDGDRMLVGCWDCDDEHNLFELLPSGRAIPIEALRADKVGCGDGALLVDDRGYLWASGNLPGTALGSDKESRLWRSEGTTPDRRGFVEVRSGSKALDIHANDLVQDPRGRIWTLGKDGEVWRIDSPDHARATRIYAHPSKEVGVSLALTGTPDDFTVWAAGSTWLVAFPNGDRHRPLPFDDPSLHERGTHGMVPRADLEHGIYLLKSNGLFEVTKSSIRRDALPVEASPWPDHGWTIARTRLGIFVVLPGDDGASVWLQDVEGAEFRRVAEMLAGSSVIAESPDGEILFTSSDGTILEWVDGELERHARIGVPLPFRATCPLSPERMLANDDWGFTHLLEKNRPPRPTSIERGTWRECASLASDTAIALLDEQLLRVTTTGDEVDAAPIEIDGSTRGRALDIARVSSRDDALVAVLTDNSIWLVGATSGTERKLIDLPRALQDPRHAFVISRGGIWVDEGGGRAFVRPLLDSEWNGLGDSTRGPLVPGGWMWITRRTHGLPEASMTDIVAFDEGIAGNPEVRTPAVLFLYANEKPLRARLQTAPGTAGAPRIAVDPVPHEGIPWSPPIGDGDGDDDDGWPRLGRRRARAKGGIDVALTDRQPGYRLAAFGTRSGVTILQFETEAETVDELVRSNKWIKLPTDGGATERGVPHLRWNRTTDDELELWIGFRDKIVSYRFEESRVEPASARAAGAPLLDPKQFVRHRELQPRDGIPTGWVRGIEISDDGENAWALVSQRTDGQPSHHLVRWRFEGQRTIEPEPFVLAGASEVVLGPSRDNRAPRVLVRDVEGRWVLWNLADHVRLALDIDDRRFLRLAAEVAIESLDPQDDGLSAWSARYFLDDTWGSTDGHWWPPDVWSRPAAHQLQVFVNREGDGSSAFSVVVPLENEDPTTWKARLFSILGGFALVVIVVSWRVVLLLLNMRRRRSRWIPYVQGHPIRDVSRFYGRGDILQRLRNNIVNASFALVGQFRIGKTSIQFRLMEILESLHHDEFVFFPVFMDLQDMREHSDEAFFEIIGRALQELAEEHDLGPEFIATLSYHQLEAGTLPRYKPVHLGGDVRKLVAALDDRVAPKQSLVVLHIDECALMARVGPQARLSFRSLFQRNRIRTVLSGRRLAKGEELARLSPWWNFLTEIEVRPLTAQEARTLIVDPVRGAFRYDEDAILEILDLTRREPLEIQRLCAQVLGYRYRKHRLNRRITLAEVQAAHALESEPAARAEIDGIEADEPLETTEPMPS